MAKRGRKPIKVVPQAIVPPANEAEATRTARVIAIFPEVCTRWAEGKTIEQIAGELGVGTGTQLRKVIENNRALRVVLDEFKQFRADHMYDKAIEWAHQAASLGPLSPQGLKIGIDTLMKAAAQMSPHVYGDVKKTEIRDAKGKLVGTETTTSITPGEAYERMLKGE